MRTVTVTVNGVAYTRTVEPRLLLSDFLRHELGLTGTHVGCEHGVCGACTVLEGGRPIRSCLAFAVQMDGAELTTVEGLAPADGPLHPLQEAFREAHGLQCGFCTPGFLMTLVPFLEENPDPTEEEIREAIGGNLCRCTGYQNIVKAVRLAADGMRGGAAAGGGAEASACGGGAPAPVPGAACACGGGAPAPVPGAARACACGGGAPVPALGAPAPVPGAASACGGGAPAPVTAAATAPGERGRSS